MECKDLYLGIRIFGNLWLTMINRRNIELEEGAHWSYIAEDLVLLL